MKVFTLVKLSIGSAIALLRAIATNPHHAFHQITAQRILRAASMSLRNPRQFRELCAIYATRFREGVNSSNRAAPARNLTPSITLNPLVSVLIVNYNGKNHLEALFDSLSRLVYKNRETILVDNGSTDGSAEFVTSRYPEVRLIKLKSNVGFSEANNIGFEMARGDYICLLNNDTRCDQEFLTHLVDTLSSNPKVGAVGPKIRFWSQFSAIEIDLPVSATVLLDIDELYECASDYKKAFFQVGFSEPFMFQGKLVRRISRRAKFLVPAQCLRAGLGLHFLAEGSSQTVTVRIGDKQIAHVLNACNWQVIPVVADDSDVAPKWIINNAGSQVTDAGEVYDRGFGSPDNGDFDAADEPAALCGCAMLIRRQALLEDEPIFAKDFFAYFEDIDLSLRIRRHGYRLAYCPSSVVYHKHASTTGENSTFFRYYVTRNRILFYALHFPEQFWRKKLGQARLELTALRHRFQSNTPTQDDRTFGERIDSIFADWDRMLPQIVAGSFYDRKRHFQRLAVYNSYWNTKGGGEYYAGVIAETLQTLGPVDLVCEHDFSIEELEQRFDIDLSRCRKVIVSSPVLHHDKQVTARYDVFVNSTYSSELISNAKLNLYVVYFPCRVDKRPADANRFIAAYDLFLAISEFTKTWTRKYWGIDAETLYPSSNAQRPASGNASKTKTILNVGRFFFLNHNKKQLELIEIFKAMIMEGKLSPGWRLVLAGQVQHGHEAYFDQTRSAAEGLPVELRPNISRAELSKLYDEAAIYWHATGLGEDLEQFPERAEHFGITTLEAMGFGCVPIVFNAGGQPEIVENETNGYLFAGIDDLKKKTTHLAEMFECDPNNAFVALSLNARRRAAKFAKEHTQQRFLALLASAKRSKGTPVESELN